MNLNLKLRKTRCVICLATMTVVAAFLFWDGWRLGVSDRWNPGPQYLVLWFGMVVAGLASVLGLLLEGVSLALRHRRWRQLGTQMTETASEEDSVPGQLLPRL